MNTGFVVDETAEFYVTKEGAPSEEGDTALAAIEVKVNKFEEFIAHLKDVRVRFTFHVEVEILK